LLESLESLADLPQFSDDVGFGHVYSLGDLLLGLGDALRLLDRDDRDDEHGRDENRDLERAGDSHAAIVHVAAFAGRGEFPAAGLGRKVTASPSARARRESE
jgi:hypothetical protein